MGEKEARKTASKMLSGKFTLMDMLDNMKKSQAEYVKLMKQRDTPYRCYNVGCMLPYMDYTPRILDEIINSDKS